MARILIIDPNQADRVIISDLLERYAKEKYQSQWSLRLTAVDKIDRALDVLNQHAFELIIIDVLLAKASYYEFLHTVRQTHQQSDLPIVVLSSIDGIDLEYKCKREGASLWFTKPVHPKDFAEKIFNLILER